MFTQLGAMTPRILRVGYEAWEKSSSYMDANATHRKQKTGLVTTTVLGPRSWFRTPRRDRRAECSLPTTRPAVPQAHPGASRQPREAGPAGPAVPAVQTRPRSLRPHVPRVAGPDATQAAGLPVHA